MQQSPTCHADALTPFMDLPPSSAPPPPVAVVLTDTLRREESRGLSQLSGLPIATIRDKFQKLRGVVRAFLQGLHKRRRTRTGAAAAAALSSGAAADRRRQLAMLRTLLNPDGALMPQQANRGIVAPAPAPGIRGQGAGGARAVLGNPAGLLVVQMQVTHSYEVRQAQLQVSLEG